MKKRFGRIFAVVLAVALMLSAFPLVSFVMVQAEAVETAARFCELVNASSESSPANIKLTSDLVIDSNAESDFYGEIDGNGHVITLTTGSALFNDVKGTVRNLGVIATSPIVTPKNSKAFCGVFASQISGTVENCFSYADINVTYNISAESYIGGFCAALNAKGKITNSFSCVSISSSNTDYIGGFVGVIVEGGTIESCYSSGDIRAQDGYVAGFANIKGTANVSDTYTSCQIVNVSNDALPSGVDGLYDNQLSIMRENLENPGLSTKELLATDQLGDAFILTSTAYPALKTFYGRKWSAKAHNVIEVSTAAAAFSDVVTPHKRKEPSDVGVRIDYLPFDILIDRTNLKSLSWDIESEYCKVYDTVPTTSYEQKSDAIYGSGTHADWLQAKYEFSRNVSEAKLSVTQNGITRNWYISAYDSNPYFVSGDGSTNSPYKIQNVDQLNHVRFYSLITNAHYIMDETITNKTLEIGTFDPIEDFIGSFEGNNITFSNVVLSDDHKGDMGLFANTREGSVIQNIKINGVKSETTNNVNAGSLIGSAVGTTVTNVFVKGSNNSVKSAGIAGGVIGNAANSAISKLLISVEVDGSTVGGLIGSLAGGSLSESGSTGLVGGTALVLGGLVGDAQNASISNCYSTAAVLSKTASANAGGLIGTTTETALSENYFASVAAVKNTVWTKTQPLIGNGSGASGCTYDGEFFGDESTVSVSGNWKNKSGHYPQLTHFNNTDLSLLSTVKFTNVYQHYWSDDQSDNSTTGWIPKTIGDVSFKTPVVNPNLCNNTDVQIFEVKSTEGYGFEPKSGVNFVALKTENTSVGVRYITVLRNDLIPLRYNVSGISEKPVYLELGYSLDKTSWNYILLHVLSGEDDADRSVVYDIPKNSYISVRVFTQDGIIVQTLKINNDAVTVSTQDGSYISTSSYATAIDVLIELVQDSSPPPWGVHRNPF